jgi:hypothetical protein
MFSRVLVLSKKKKKKKRGENKCHCHLSCAGIEINVTDTLQTIMLMQREIQVTQNSIRLCQPEHRNQTLMPNCKIIIIFKNIIIIIIILLLLLLFILPNITENKLK